MNSLKSVLRGSMYQFLVAAIVEVMCRPFKVQAIRQIHSLMDTREVALRLSNLSANPFAGLVPQLLHDALIILSGNVISHLVMGKLHHILRVGTRIGNFGFWLTFKVISKCTTTCKPNPQVSARPIIFRLSLLPTSPNFNCNVRPRSTTATAAWNRLDLARCAR